MMVTIVNFVRKSYTMLPLCAILLFVSCAQQNTIRHQFSGEDYFQAIYFGDGEAAKVIDHMPKTIDMLGDNDLRRDAIQQIEQEVIAEIKRQDADFFVGFQQAMETANHQKIDLAIKDGTQKYYSAIENIVGLQNMEEVGEFYLANYQTTPTEELKTKLYDKIASNYDTGDEERLAGIDLWFEKETFVYEDFAVAVAVAAALLIVITQIDATPIVDPDGGLENALQYEQMVNSIAQFSEANFQ